MEAPVAAQEQKFILYFNGVTNHFLQQDLELGTVWRVVSLHAGYIAGVMRCFKNYSVTETTSPSTLCLSHQLPQVFRWPSHLRESQTSLYTLQELSRNLITHNMTFLAIVKFLSSTTLVNTNHSNSNGPSGFSNAEAKIPVICINIASFL